MARDPARQQQSEPLAELLDRLRVAKLGDIETGGKSEDVQDLVVVPGENLAEDWECAICLENAPGVEDVIMASVCQHRFHLGCLMRHAAEEVKKRRSVIRCPFGCSDLAPSVCAALLSAELLRQLVLLAEEAAVPAQLRCYCPKSTCSALIVLDACSLAHGYAVCHQCGKKVCTFCNQEFKEGHSCSSDAQDGMYDPQFRILARSKDWRRCPACSHFIEKDGGCNSVTCRCGRRFMWDIAGVNRDDRLEEGVGFRGCCIATVIFCFVIFCWSLPFWIGKV